MTNTESGNALIGEDVMDEIGNETGDPVWFIYFAKENIKKTLFVFIVVWWKCSRKEKS